MCVCEKERGRDHPVQHDLMSLHKCASYPPGHHGAVPGWAHCSCKEVVVVATGTSSYIGVGPTGIVILAPAGHMTFLGLGEDTSM